MIEGQLPEIPGQTEGELPNELMYGLLGSVGNGEQKCLDVIVMGANPKKVHSRADLHREIMSRQEPNRRWEISKNVPFDHCEKSLAPIGLVAKEALSQEGRWGYIITPYGIQTGTPFVGGLLKWSYEHPNFSLYQMFGSTNSSSTRGKEAIDKKRAPETRYKLLSEIVTNPRSEIRAVDLINAIGEGDSIISDHLFSLGKHNIITYQAVEAGKPFAFYRLIDSDVLDKQPEPLGETLTLSTQVLEILKANKGNYLTSESLTDLLIENYPNYRERKRRPLISVISRILVHLEKQRYVEREKFVGRQFQSEITLTDEQRESIVSLLQFLDKFQKGDSQTLREGREFALKIASNPSLFSSLMLKAKEASPNANATDRETMEANILSILDQNSNITANVITQLLEQKYGKKISYYNVRGNYLQRLVQNGRIKAEKTKSGNVYRVAEEEIQTPSAQN